jgi:hypothetical protein
VSPKAHTALFTELVGQVCTGIVKGGFPTQKVCKLHGFDYVQVGLIDEQEYLKNFPSFQQKVAAKIQNLLLRGLFDVAAFSNKFSRNTLSHQTSKRLRRNS